MGVVNYYTHDVDHGSELLSLDSLQKSLLILFLPDIGEDCGQCDGQLFYLYLSNFSYRFGVWYLDRTGLYHITLFFIVDVSHVVVGAPMKNNIVRVFGLRAYFIGKPTVSTCLMVALAYSSCTCSLFLHCSCLNGNDSHSRWQNVKPGKHCK